MGVESLTFREPRDTVAEGGMMTRRTLIAIGVAGACLVGFAPAWATFPGANGRIAFTSGPPAKIATMQPDGRAVEYLRAGSDPAWSANGRRIAFVRYPNNQGGEIYTMRADGSKVRRVTFTPDANDSGPAFSPNGRRIVYTSAKQHPARYRVISIRSDGSHRRVLAWRGLFPDWAPNGKHIVYQGGGIRIMRPDGTQKQRLYAPSEFGTGSPHYNPSGHSIIFGRCHLLPEGGCGETEWMQIGTSGGDLHRLPISSDVFLVQPAPEGRCFVGWSWRAFDDGSEGQNIYATGPHCPAEGWLTGYRQPQAASQPAWQPLP
jgi:WD40-like Beta Propeller Repeat